MELTNTRWFQIRKSSPLTGLVLENTDLRVNGELAIQVRDWIGGNDLVQSAPAVAAAASSSQSPRPMTVRFFSRLGSFNRQVPRTTSLNTLYRIAFRGLKGRHTQFELHFKSALLEPSESSLESATIRHNSIIHIDVPDTRSAKPVAEAINAELEELCLIKVYRNYDQMLFSYWVPRRTTNTFASVIFKYWRRLFKSDSRQYISDLLPWTNMTDQGDGHRCGTCQDHWNKLSEFLNARFSTGKLKNEKMYDVESPELSEDSSDEDVEMEDQQIAAPLVLKVLMGGKPSSKNKSGKNLSRVSEGTFCLERDKANICLLARCSEVDVRCVCESSPGLQLPNSHGVDYLPVFSNCLARHNPCH
jgi:hypothetical protein